jgi:hypothetical protein
MPRLHLVDLEDLSWFPAPVRDAGTGYLQLMIHVSVPLVRLMVLWDGVVSYLRTYDVRELRALVESVSGGERFDWEIGEFAGKAPIPVTYLIGVPRAWRIIAERGAVQ